MNVGFSATAMITGIFPSPPGAGKGHPFELRAGPFFGGELQVVSLHGRERVNDVYQYEVTFAAEAPPEIVCNALFGMPACLTIKAPGHEPRVIQGLASSIEAIGALPGEQTRKRHRFRLEIVPRLWLLRHRRRNRIFQNKTIPEIVRTVLSDVGIKDTDCRWRADRAAFPKLPFVYQRGESDYEFFRRVLASAGIFFFYEHANGFLDSMFGGAASAVAGEVGAVAGMLGGAVGSAVGAVESALGMVPVLNFSSQAGHTAAVTPALAGLADEALGAGAGALASAVGGPAGSVIGAVAGAIEEPSDTLQFDDGMGADADEERVFEFALKKELRTKQLRMLDRDVEAAASCVGVASVPDVSLNLSAGLSLSPKGLSAHVGASFDLDAPTIPSSMLRQELYQTDFNVWQDLAPSNADPPVSLSVGLAASLSAASATPQSAAGAKGPAPLYNPDFLIGKRLGMELDRERRKYQQAVGRSDCRRLGAGYRFTLAGHPIGMLNGEYTVTALDVEGTHPDFAGDGEAVYRNRFRCVPSSVAPRPKRPKRRPKPGMEVARVIGYQGGNVFPGLEANAAGYVHVRFRWDILDDEGTENGSLQIGSNDDAYAVWLPVVQPWAGAGYGAQFIPREGMEVLVGFMEDQSERPVILGCLYSDKNRPPWPEYIDHQKVGIRSQTRPANGGYSEISIDDRQRGEVVQVRAQKDLREDVLNDRTATIGHDYKVQVGAQKLVSVARDATDHIGGNRDERIALTRSETIGRNRVCEIGNDQRLTTHGNRVEVVAGDSLTTVHKESSLDVHGNMNTVIGTASTPGTYDILTWGNHRIGSQKALSLQAADSLTLACGDSSITLSTKGISIKGAKLEIAAAKSVTVSGNGPSLALGDDAELVAKTVRVFSTNASLELDDRAHLDGKQVLLNSKRSSPPTRNPDGSPALLQHLSLKLTDSDFKPYANKPFALTVLGRKYEGTTDGAGNMEMDVPKEAELAEAIVWIETKPTGNVRRYRIQLGELGDPRTVQGAQARLRNLGYFWGPPSDTLTEEIRDALRKFQSDHNIEASGELDDATSSRLSDVHGH